MNGDLKSRLFGFVLLTLQSTVLQISLSVSPLANTAALGWHERCWRPDLAMAFLQTNKIDRSHKTSSNNDIYRNSVYNPDVHIHNEGQ